MVPSCQEAYDTFINTVMPQLEAHGEAIGAAAQEGDEGALEVLRLYQLLAGSFDPTTTELLEQALQRWLNALVQTSTGES